MKGGLSYTSLSILSTIADTENCTQKMLCEMRFLPKQTVNAVVQKLSLHGFHIVAVSFIMMAYNVFSSGWFTALNDGTTSAVLSFCRTIIFMVLPVLILPRIFGSDGVWLSMSVGEGMSLLMTFYYFHKYRAVWTAKPAEK